MSVLPHKQHSGKEAHAIYCKAKLQSYFQRMWQNWVFKLTVLCTNIEQALRDDR